MTTIPDDIMKAAMEAYLSLMDDDLYDDHKYGSGHIARAYRSIEQLNLEGKK